MVMARPCAANDLVDSSELLYEGSDLRDADADESCGDLCHPVNRQSLFIIYKKSTLHPEKYLGVIVCHIRRCANPQTDHETYCAEYGCTGKKSVTMTLT